MPFCWDRQTQKLSEDDLMADHPAGLTRRKCSSGWTGTRTANCRRTSCLNLSASELRVRIPTKTVR